MADFLEEIFHREEEDYRSAPGYREAQRKLETYHVKIEKAFGFEFMDSLVAAEARVCNIDTLTAYRHGFHLAGRLLLELLSPRP